MGRRKKNEIIVSAPSKLNQQSTEKTQTIEKEKIETLDAAQKFGKTFFGLTIAAGVLLLIFSVYLLITGPLTNLPEMRLFFIVMLAFLGIVNTVSGLLLMARN